MNEVWDLTPLYKGFDDPAYEADMAAMKALVADFTAFSKELPNMEPVAGLRRGVELLEKLADLSKLFGYANLRSATNTKDPEPGSYMGRIMAIRSGMAAPSAAFNAWVVQLPNLMELVRGDEYLKDYEFYFAGKVDSARYQMSGEAESVMAKMGMSGGSAWGKLQSYLTSTVPVSYRGTTTNLSAIRNLAYDPDPQVRKDAYEAEIACYEAIKEPVAHALNAIKLETISQCQLRGYESPLDRSKPDTGMHRLGFMNDELPELLDFLRTCPYVRVKSVYSHLAAADDPCCDQFTLGQIAMFKENADRLTESLGYKPLYHILNSAGIERFPQYQFDMVRLGIGVYGVSAIPGNRLSPVASFKCKILQIKTLKPEDGAIGYGQHGKIAEEGTVVATIPVGYADGLDRHLSCGKGRFMVNGHKVPVIGNICMDMTMLDVTGIDAKVGDTVTIFGEDPTVTELADILGTIPYEILTSVPRRIERIITHTKE